MQVLPQLLPFQMAPGSVQFCWLTNDLASSTKPWKFLFLHLPVMHSGHHRFDDENGNGIYDFQELQELLAPMANQYGVQRIFSGHDHDYERLNPRLGVQQIVTGGGGRPSPVLH